MKRKIQPMPLTNWLLQEFQIEFGSRTEHLCTKCGQPNRHGVRETAKILGISPATVSRLMRGYKPNANTVDILYERYGKLLESKR